MKKLSLILSLTLVQGHLVFAQSSASRRLGKFKGTWYCLALESDYSDEARRNLLDLRGHVIATVPAAFKRDLDVEGSGKLRDARVVNYAGTVGGEYRYHIANHPFGDGIGTCPLVPFHTISVDPNVIPLGSVVRIAETEGMKLPDGTLHDGLWRAEDRGGGVHGSHIDLFVGAGKASSEVLHRNGIQDTQLLTLEIVQGPSASNCVHKNTLPAANADFSDEEPSTGFPQ